MKNMFLGRWFSTFAAATALFVGGPVWSWLIRFLASPDAAPVVLKAGVAPPPARRFAQPSSITELS